MLIHQIYYFFLGVFAAVLILIAFLVSSLCLWRWDMYQRTKTSLMQTKAISTALETMMANMNDPNQFVVASKFMRRLVNDSKESRYSFHIQEAFFLGSSQQILAHSHPLRMGRSQKNRYKYTRPGNISGRISGNMSEIILEEDDNSKQFFALPTQWEETSITQVAREVDIYFFPLANMLRMFLPERLPVAYHVGLLSFPSRGVQGSQGVHLVGKLKNFAHYLNIKKYYSDHFFYLLFLGLASFTLLIFLFLYLFLKNIRLRRELNSEACDLMFGDTPIREAIPLNASERFRNGY